MGILVDFEGIDGSGKETQLKLLSRWLRGKGRKTRVYAYPSRKGVFGRVVHKFLKNKIELSAKRQFLLFGADILSEQEKIRKEIEACDIVLLNRYIISTVAYQCAKGFPFENALAFVKAHKFVKPDVVFLLDVDEGKALARKRKQKRRIDRHEADRDLLACVRRNYLMLFKRRFFAKRWVKLDAGKGEEEIAREVEKRVARMLKGIW